MYDRLRELYQRKDITAENIVFTRAAAKEETTQQDNQPRSAGRVVAVEELPEIAIRASGEVCK